MKISSFTYFKPSSGVERSIELYTAFTFWQRFFGFMGKKSSHIGMIFNKTNQIHMFFMRFPLHVYFLDKEGTVIHIIHHLKPWRVSPRIKDARYVIELPVGCDTEMEVGDLFLHNKTTGE